MTVLPSDSWPGRKEQPAEGGPAKAGRQRRNPRGSRDRRPEPPGPDRGPRAAAPDAPPPEGATHEGALELPRAGYPSVGHPLPTVYASPTSPVPGPHPALTEAETEAAIALPSLVRYVVSQARTAARRDAVRTLLALHTVATGGGRGRDATEGGAALLSRVHVGYDREGRAVVTIESAASSSAPSISVAREGE